MALAISSGCATRPSGTVETRPAFLSALPAKRLSIPVSVGRCYRINANARLRAFERRGFGETLDGVLAGGIDRGATGASMAVGRGDIDDGAAALSEHHPQLMLHAEERAEHIGIERRGVAVGGLLRHRAGLAFGAGAVDGRIQTTEARDGLIHEVARIVFAAHVGMDELGFGAEARNSMANACPASSCRPETMSRLPSLAKARAAARPMPVNAPVIKTTGLPTDPVLHGMALDPR